MNNPYPIAQARRIELRRKHLGYPTRCFYCPETNIFCFEEDHPVTEDLDSEFKRVVCRNCHRKLEGRRDIKRLTKNGQRNLKETEAEALQRFFLLIAEDQDTIADVVRTSPSELIESALKANAASIRRKLKTVTLV